MNALHLPPSRLGDCAWARDIDDTPVDPISDEDVEAIESLGFRQAFAGAFLALLLCTPAFADTLEVRTGYVATVYEGVVVDSQLHEGLGRIDFSAWNSYQKKSGLGGTGSGNWTVIIDGQSWNDCALITAWSRAQSPVSLVVRCAP